MSCQRTVGVMLKEGHFDERKGRRKGGKGELMLQPHDRETEIWDELAIETITKAWMKQEHYVST